MKKLSSTEHAELIKTLKTRFEKNMNRHKGIEWTKVQVKLDANPKKMCSLYEMENTGGEPDVVGLDKKTGEYIFYDCSTESQNDCYCFHGIYSLICLKRYFVSLAGDGFAVSEHGTH